eukprot:scaffold34546_cov194-Skeletonema_menzelii.AAC.1
MAASSVCESDVGRGYKKLSTIYPHDDDDVNEDRSGSGSFERFGFIHALCCLPILLLIVAASPTIFEQEAAELQS